MLPHHHIDSLERHVRVHEERLTILREQLKNQPRGDDPNPKGDPNPKPPLLEKPRLPREVLEREVRFHQELVDLARDPRVLTALKDLTENPDFARWAARDPRAVAQKLGIKLPAALQLQVSNEADGVRVGISSYDGLYPFKVTWHSDSGFSPVPEPLAARKGVAAHGH